MTAEADFLPRQSGDGAFASRADVVSGGGVDLGCSEAGHGRHSSLGGANPRTRVGEPHPGAAHVGPYSEVENVVTWLCLSVREAGTCL